MEFGLKFALIAKIGHNNTIRMRRNMIEKMQETIKILIVDDHQLIRKGIASILDEIKGLHVIAEASDGEEAIRLAREHNPDVILMDIQMPGMGGMEATKKILRVNPDARILALTVCESDIYPARLLEEGAAGYITKDSTTEEMVRAIRTIVTGQRYISPSIAQKLAIKRFTTGKASPFEVLSERELQVLLMITRGRKVPDIAEILHLSTKTINTYRYRIFEKLGVKSDVELTHLALQHGIIENV